MQRLDNLRSLKRARNIRLTGPVAMLFVEDDVEVASSMRHLMERGFRSLLLFAPPEIAVDPETCPDAIRIDWRNETASDVSDAVNAVIAKGPGLWMHYCFNAEYLFFPFCESRSVGEMLHFQDGERRDAMLTYVIDLYAQDAALHGAAHRDTAHLDRSGYYAISRPDPVAETGSTDRQLDFFGGLRWRYEEHVPRDRRRIDRIGLFRARRGLRLRPDHTFAEPEYNTFACRWHHNLTAAICSFRAAKALVRNGACRDQPRSFMWDGSVRFTWHSRQLLDLGLIEPGQWF